MKWSIDYSGDFNPRSREGSDFRPHGYLPSTGISIHAPVKGATIFSAGFRPQPRDFNPRSREGSDPEDDEKVDWKVISIHAPVKGATRAVRTRIRVCGYFNPRSREGSDCYAPMAYT